MVAVALIATLGGMAFGGGGLARAAGVPLRQVDWRAVLASDPAITIDPTAYQLPVDVGPYISVVAPGSPEGQLSGYALLDEVAYGDLDGDGAEEAVLSIFSGGTGGNLGFLLFREGSPAPKLVLVESGYKMGVEIDGRNLVIVQPEYVGFEANCCPSAITRAVARLQGDRLVTIAKETEPNDVQEPTVWSFYRALSDREYEEAYAFLSPTFKASNPFDRWKSGYASTRSIEVETSPGPTPNVVLIELTAVDARPGGGTVTQKFRGSWTVVWSGEQKRWLLDRAQISPV
jgi:hypothetical protein